MVGQRSVAAVRAKSGGRAGRAANR